MLLLIDEDVPRAVTEFFRARGHEVVHILDVALPSTKDPVVAAIADEMGAVVVTWNARDFKSLAPKAPRGTWQRFRRMGWINFKCRESHGLRRVQEHIESIEFHYAQAQKRRDKRFMIEILEEKFNVFA